MTQAHFTVDELEQVQILRGVDLASVAPLLASCEVIEMLPQQIVIHRGEENSHLYLILSGRLRVHLKSPDEAPLARLEAGEAFGELSMIDRRPASAYVVTDSPTRLLAIDEDILWTLVDRSHAVAINLLAALAHRLRYGNEVIYQNMELLREYRWQALVDPLTALFNRRWLDKMLPRQMERSEREGIPLSLLMIDVDHFKDFNDRFGHGAGDRVLRRVGRELQDKVRPGDLVARYGGEEMAVLLPDARLEDAMTVAERLRAAVAIATIGAKEGTPLPPVTISVGAARCAGEQTPEAFIQAADEALYRAKREGRNRVSA